MKHIERIQLIYNILKNNKFSINQILDYLKTQNATVSRRQLIRDLKDLKYFLDFDEEIKITYNLKEKYFCILKSITEKEKQLKTQSKLINTNFYKQIKSDSINKQINLIELCIQKQLKLHIEELINDETGDNHLYETKHIKFLPISIVYHRDTYYLGGWNIKRKCVQFFGVNQLKKLSIIDQHFANSDYISLVNNELQNRFGITKNIDDKVYDIILEFPANIGAFIKSHHWHPTQKIKKVKGCILISMTCGINRELLGWLFQWMYNVRIIQPTVLKTYYENTILEINKNYTSNSPLVYKNIFNK